MRSETVRTPHGVDKYLFMETSEIVPTIEQHASALRRRGGDWYGDSFEDFTRHAAIGDNSRVEASEEFLAQIEDQVPMSRGWRNVDDVVGAIPNVPAFLAGHPQHMRRRQRTSRDTTPLFIYMDLTSSAGISSTHVERRGVVLLALTRLLVEHRPVELWVGTAIGNQLLSSTVAWRVDTAPLDLARAAYHVAATAMSRLFGYGLSHELHNSEGAWPFNSYDLHCRTAESRLRAVLGSGGELLYVPPIHMQDEMTRNPIGWLRRTMAKYVQQEE